MYLVTFHGTVLCKTIMNRLQHQSLDRKKITSSLLSIDFDAEAARRLRDYDGEVEIGGGPLGGYRAIPHFRLGHVLRKDGRYLCAVDKDGALITTEVPGVWEVFHFAESLGEPRAHGSPEEENRRFAARVAQLQAEGKAVKLYCGAGRLPRRGFLNLDVTPMLPAFSTTDYDDYFIFDFCDRRWQIPNDSVDYVYHEDFIEHIDQTNQFQFLAESRRVMKPGSWQRVNTPNLIWAMRHHSDFNRGLEGVYTGERQWGHIAILTRDLLAAMARTVGFREVHFTGRDGGRSPHAVPDIRPGADRPDIEGNIFADLLK
ncbi:hypothetical protein [Methylobacterium sp. ID0610]|uniref:hypothetical protein n=1 Tax=Methylobacterium carpenticola TaxID=3344827 RepID=UPI003674E0D6